MKLNPYLNFNGNCREAFEYYEKHLGGKILAMMTHAEVPAGTAGHPDWGAAILHARIALGDTVVMASDVPPDVQQPMRSAYLSLSVASPQEAERIYPLLSDGGEVFMPLQETFWAHRFAITRDRFGTLWMINAEKSMGVPKAA